MKRLGLILLSILMLGGCAGSGMNLTYKAPMEQAFNSRPVYLKVVDARKDKLLVTPAVMQKDLFRDVGDRLNLKSEGADGTVTDIKGVPVEKAFYEAFRIRFDSLGIGILPEPDPTSFGLTIEIEKILLDVGDTRTLKADVTYLAKFFDGDKQFWSQRIAGTTQRFYVLGSSGGESALSEALTSAVNSLDLSKFKQQF